MKTPTPSKEKVLADVGTLVQSGAVTLKDLERVYTYNLPEGAKPETPAVPADTATAESAASRPTGIATALYVVGTVIVCAGIYMVIAQNWNQLNTIFRIGFTLGLGLAVLAAAIWRARRAVDVNRDLFASSLFTIAAVALAIGVGVCAVEAGYDGNEPGVITGVAVLLFGVFTSLYLKVARSLALLYFAVIATVVTYFAAIEWITDDMIKSDQFYPVEIAIAGMLVIAGGIALHKRVIASRISDTLYYLGAIMTLGGAFALTFTASNYGDNSASALAYHVLFPFILAGAVWLSVFVRSRSVLVVAAFFLTCYIFKLSATYFSDVLGGSVAICLAGVLVIAMAYATTKFAKRYIKR